MNHRLNDLKWIALALTKEVEELSQILPNEYPLSIELVEHCESVVVYDLSNVRAYLSTVQLTALTLLNNYIIGLMNSQAFLHGWYKDEFIQSQEWQHLKCLANNFIEAMGWDDEESLEPLCCKLLFINSKVYYYITSAIMFIILTLYCLIE